MFILSSDVFRSSESHVSPCLAFLKLFHSFLHSPVVVHLAPAVSGTPTPVTLVTPRRGRVHSSAKLIQLIQLMHMEFLHSSSHLCLHFHANMCHFFRRHSSPCVFPIEKEIPASDGSNGSNARVHQNARHNAGALCQVCASLSELQAHAPAHATHAVPAAILT